MCNTIKYKSPFGIITIQEKDGAISHVYLPNAEPSASETCDISENTSELLEKARIQFDEYFNGKRKIFDLPLNFEGCTDFMKSVYQELLKIPYGETATYKNIAERVGCPKGFRAVGLANNKNPLPIIVPCHRVIGSDGKLVGFAGGIDMKVNLLELEKTIRN
jgi:methylated-DNA-[protein]-cysteine S-methyltransferase